MPSRSESLETNHAWMTSAVRNHLRISPSRCMAGQVLKAASVESLNLSSVPFKEAGLASMALHLAAGGLGNAARPGAAPPCGLAHHALRPPPAEWPEPRPRHPAANARWDERALPRPARCEPPVGSGAPLRRRRSVVLRPAPSTENAAQQAGRKAGWLCSTVNSISWG